MDPTWPSAADKLKKLITVLEAQSKRRASTFGCAPTAFQNMLALYPVAPPPELLQFLCAVSPQKTVDIGLISLMSPADLLDYQTGSGPVESTARFGLMALGSWSGEGDGDAWVCNLHDGSIHALNLECGYEDTLEDTLETTSISQRSEHGWTIWSPKPKSGNGFGPGR